MRKSSRHIELLGAIAIPDDEYQSSPYARDKIQAQFESLHDNLQKGDWYLPGAQLLSFIREHAQPHICRRSCTGGTSIYEEIEELRALDEAKNDERNKAFNDWILKQI